MEPIDYIVNASGSGYTPVMRGRNRTPNLDCPNTSRRKTLHLKVGSRPLHNHRMIRTPQGLPTRTPSLLTSSKPAKIAQSSHLLIVAGESMEQLLPQNCEYPFEVCLKYMILYSFIGIWDHNIGNSCGLYYYMLDTMFTAPSGAPTPAR